MKQSIEKLMNDSFDMEKETVKKLLDEELSKPERDRDYERIDEMINAHISLMGIEESVKEQTAAGMSRLQARLREKKPRVRPAKRIRMLMTAGIAAVMVLALNIVSVAAFQRDIFSVVVEYAETSFSVKYPSGNDTNLPTTPDDPYGIKAECAKYGMDVLAPTYLPEGFELYDCKATESQHMVRIEFWYYRNCQDVVKISYTNFLSSEFSSSIPTNDFNLHEIDIHGTPAIVSEEDDQYTAIFKKDCLETIITTDCGYAEGDKITASLE